MAYYAAISRKEILMQATTLTNLEKMMPKKPVRKVHVSHDSIHTKIHYREAYRERKISCGLGLGENGVVSDYRVSFILN